MKDKTPQQQEQFLDEWLNGADHDFAQVRQVVDLRQRQAAIASASATVTVQQQEPIVAMTSSQLNTWFSESFKNHMERHIKTIQKGFDNVFANLDVICGAMGGKKDEKGMVVPSLGDDVQDIEKDIKFIVEMLGGEIRVESNNRTLRLGRLDDLIAKRVDKILNDRAQQLAGVSKTVGIIDEILTKH